MKGIHWLLLGLLPITVLSQKFQYGTRFPKNKLYNLEANTIGLDGIDGTIAAFGDFNGDKLKSSSTDIFVLSADQTSVSVYLWNHEAFSFKSLPKARTIQPGFIITNVVPGDYNYDGKLDVLLMGEQNPEKNPNKEIKMQIYLGNGNDTFEPEAIKLDSAVDSLPIVLDINGDMKTDILGYAESTNELSIWMNTAVESGNNTSLYNLTSASTIFDKASTDKCVWSNPHSNAFVDLNGDCLADLVFVCGEAESKQSIQIWTNDRDNGFKLSLESDLPAGSGPLTFADMDGDGSIDIIFPVCKDQTCSIHVVYNQQMGLCSKSQEQSNTSCRKAQNLCVADPHFKFDLSKPNTKDHAVIPMESYLNKGEYIRVKDDNFRGHLPIPIHVGDYNMDGYPDLLVTTSERVILLESIPCDSNICSSATEKAGRRSFELVTAGADILNKISNPSQAAFFDIDENGSLDILILQHIKGKDAGRTPNFVINNFFNDAFFLKGLVSNGVTNLEAYGVSYPGASIKFTVLDTSGVKRSRQISQLSQSGYLSLQTPYCLFGLGRTNNYVEELFAGVSRHQEKNYFFYEGVIPNSQLVFLPYQPDHVQDSSSWKVELYIKPADYVPWVLGVLVGASIILAIVVVVLRTMEKREDEMERRKALHIINFDAL
ncbi:hypothetical protein HPULCUR_003412 [Helicostylum pulchrum]|uniref:T-cell immunomodulatory protein TIP C2 domain-containing protein n=1 Tax=Helicostylum pulchrum TaxID=562976 RepID=A0ABP9XTB5_9FUNG